MAPFAGTTVGWRRSLPTRFTLTWSCRVHEVSFVTTGARSGYHFPCIVINNSMARAPFDVYWPCLFSCNSTDKTLIVWDLTRDELNYGIPKKRLYGHSHFVSDVVLSSDGNYALSGSWDKTLRLWDLAAGRTTRRFEDHTKVQYISSFFFTFFFFIITRSFTAGWVLTHVGICLAVCSLGSYTKAHVFNVFCFSLGRIECCILCWQPSNRFWKSG